MKPGNLVFLSGNHQSPKVWIVLRITSHKKIWHRKLTIMSSKRIANISWKFKDKFIILQ